MKKKTAKKKVPVKEVRENVQEQELSSPKLFSQPTARFPIYSDGNNFINHYESYIAPSISLISRNWLADPSLDQQLSLQQEINELKRKLQTSFQDLNQANTENDRRSRALENLKAELQAKEKINHILPRINIEARQKMLSDHNFKNKFKDGETCECVVVSIDIRRSTELMLKARRPDLFSKFITQLSQQLGDSIISNYGIFDKFTGDGILAFFPKFYSSDFALVKALKAAKECHQIFFNHYRNSRDCFNVFIKDVGLGIGVDYGTVTLVNSGNELTVVGIPVVYACRMSGGKAGDTLLNQPALEEVVRICHDHISISESEIDIKNEGKAIAYKVDILTDKFDSELPKWMNSKSARKRNVEKSQTNATRIST